MAGDSMNIGITGLDAYQAQIDVISNNIANVGTTAYKGQNLSFQDLLYQTQQPGSGPTKTSGGVNYQQVGIGVKIGGTDTNSTQGGVQSTGVTTNMMINGDGYFIMKNADGTGTPKYTRNGDFSLSSTGLLFNPASGEAVMGYPADATGKIVSGAPGPITVPIGLKSLATATGAGVKGGPTGDKVFDMGWGGNLDTTSYAKAVAAAATATAAPAVAAAVAANALAASNTAAAAATTAISTTLNADDAAAATALNTSYSSAVAAAGTATTPGTAAQIAQAATDANTAANTLSTETSKMVTGTVNANSAAAATGATAASVAAAVTAPPELVTAANTAKGLPGATPATVAAAVAAFATQFNTDSAAAGVAFSKAIALLNASNAATASSTSISSTTTPTSIAAAFTASATTNTASAGTTIYDSLGNPHLMNVAFTPANLGAAMPLQVNDRSGNATTAATAWTYTLSSTDGTLFSNGKTTSPPQYAFFDQNGQFINTSGTLTPLPTTVHAANSLPSTAAGDQLAVTQWGTPVGANNSSSVVAPAAPGPIGVDLSRMSANGATAQVIASYQNGYAPGTLDNMSVGTDGTITGSYTNGQTLAIAQVALATFQNEAGLLRTGGSNYVQSVDSGEAQVGSAATGRFGSITGNALELSNVSIGDEFTKLITAQNAFTANSKSITTANTDDQTVINLIR